MPLVEMEKLFKEVAASSEYGPSLYILNGPKVNIPELWYKFWHREDIYGPKKFKERQQ